jgi:hypothetical protein
MADSLGRLGQTSLSGACPSDRAEVLWGILEIRFYFDHALKLSQLPLSGLIYLSAN